MRFLILMVFVFASNLAFAAGGKFYTGFYAGYSTLQELKDTAGIITGGTSVSGLTMTTTGAPTVSLEVGYFGDQTKSMGFNFGFRYESERKITKEVQTLLYAPLSTRDYTNPPKLTIMDVYLNFVYVWEHGIYTPIGVVTSIPTWKDSTEFSETHTLSGGSGLTAGVYFPFGKSNWVLGASSKIVFYKMKKTASDQTTEYSFDKIDASSSVVELGYRFR